MQRFRMYVLTGLALFMPCILISCAATPVSITEDVPRMDKEELRSLLDNPDVVVLDVRTSSQWSQSAYKIRGARRLDQSNADRVEEMYPKDKTIVIYCS